MHRNPPTHEAFGIGRMPDEIPGIARPRRIDNLSIDLDRAFTATPAAFSSGMRDTLHALSHATARRTRFPIRRAMLITALLIVGLAGAAVAAQLTGLLNLFLPVAPGAEHQVLTNAAVAKLEDCSAQIREVIWDGETLGMVYVVNDPALLAVEGFTPPTTPDQVRLSSKLDQYGSRYMAEQITLGDGQTLSPTTMDVRWGDTPDQVLYYLEFALVADGTPREISILPYCSKGELPMHFTLNAPNAEDVRDYAPPAPAAFDGFTVRVTRHRETPLRTYVDLEVKVAPELSPEAAKAILDRWGMCTLFVGEGGVINMQGSATPGEPFGYATTMSLYGKAAGEYKGPWSIAPVDDDGNTFTAESITLSDKPLK